MVRKGNAFTKEDNDEPTTRPGKGRQRRCWKLREERLRAVVLFII
jgi:hypothetical protein